MAALGRALELAEPEGHVMVFAAEGTPMAILVTAAARRSNSNYMAELVTACTRSGLAVRQDTFTPPQSVLVAPLSTRELAVLRLLASDLNGPDIARELMVSLNTVRSHTKSIYAKLGVNSRRTAVRQANNLNLITPHKPR